MNNPNENNTLVAEILSVGTELLLGNVANTDAQDVAVALSEYGIGVYRMSVVGDNDARLVEAVRAAASRSDIIITTGGLGPTYDDMTKEGVAHAFGKALEYREEEGDKIRAFFRDKIGNMTFTENNLRQAYFPEGSQVLDNGAGTAPGCAFLGRVPGTDKDVHVVMLPGPPRELRSMIETGLKPYLARLSDSVIVSRNIHIFGVGESEVEARLLALMASSENPTLAPYAKEGEVMLRATAKTKTAEEAAQLLAPLVESVLAELGDAVYGLDAGSLEGVVVSHLLRQSKTLACVESCTGGLFAKRVTDIPGASQVFLGGITAYTQGAKENAADVPSEVIGEFGLVSRQTAEEMAKAAVRVFGTDFGVGITGVAGPGADADGNPEGTVFVAVYERDSGTTTSRELPKFSGRARVRDYAASSALDMVRRVLQQK
ncbi:MAG: competence/damage-inducible protein A [Oscillospiraceae bacterium]|jgi:nicotinamide-nucleotide amidase|nr:competence/damage-inducible protein A [Oscillospiraceae bacterium]